MNFTLFKVMIKKNWVIWFGFTAFLLLEMTVCILMMDMIAEMLGEAWPFAGNVSGESALVFVSSLFPTYGYMFPMIFYIIVINKLLSKTVDNTSMSCYLTSGITRKQYIITAGVFVLFSVFMMFAAVFIICGLCMLRWGSLDWGRWANLNISVLMVNLAVVSVSFFFASVFAASGFGNSMMICLPIILLLIYMLSGYLDFLQYLSPFGWINAEKIALGTFKLWWLWDLVYAAIAGAFFTASLVLFKKKQLSI